MRDRCGVRVRYEGEGVRDEVGRRRGRGRRRRVVAKEEGGG